MNTFGEAGVGIFPASAAIETELKEHHKVDPLGQMDGVMERFYAIPEERKLIPESPESTRSHYQS